MEKIKEVKIKFEGIDEWCRATFRQQGTAVRFAILDKLFAMAEKDQAIAYAKENPHKIELKGVSFDDEPLGGNSPRWKFKFLD